MKHVVGFSGGIDSQACCGVILDRYGPEDVILLNSQAGRNEHPLTVEHVQWYSTNVHPVIEVVPQVRDLGEPRPGSKRTLRRESWNLSPTDEMDFELVARINGGFPSRKRQWCTEVLKLAPQRRWMRENLYENGIECIRYAGVRRDESKARANTPDCKWDDYHDCVVCFPIAAWTKEHCFDFVKGRGEKINPLYTMGFARVGCSPCINSNKDDVREWAARFPEMIDKIRRWETSVGKAFFAPCVPGKTINWVDEVVEWSRTAHGGKRTTLPFVEQDATDKTCVSKYGLCE